MAEDQGEKENQKFEFTPEGETFGYISMDQARVLAMQHARDNTDFYGAAYSRINLVREVISQEEGEDYYLWLFAEGTSGQLVFNGTRGFGSWAAGYPFRIK